MNIEDIIKTVAPVEVKYSNLHWIRTFTVNELLWASIQPDWILSSFGLSIVSEFRDRDISKDNLKIYGVAFTPDKDTELILRLSL